jgi:riboflavin synthase
MFTGIVTAVGRVAKATRETGNGKRETGLILTIHAPFKGVKQGESIAVSGACLTVERVVKGGFKVHVVETTEGRTLFGEYAAGRRVNLERALRATDRLGGHIVQGHVDGVGQLRSIRADGDAHWMTIQFPPALAPFIVRKGSIAVDGISLTVADLRDDEFDVMIIPFTWEHTNVSAVRADDRVNLEADMVGKYVARAVELTQAGR